MKNVVENLVNHNLQSDDYCCELIVPDHCD